MSAKRIMISVIVPIYNAEKFLDRCIQSIIQQTYADLEIILIDDGSIDGSAVICKAYASSDARIIYLYQDNKGVSFARNQGLLIAKGDYVMFVDSDDYMLPTMCEIMVNTIESKGGDCVVCGIIQSDGTSWTPDVSADYNQELFRLNFIGCLNSELLSPVWNKIYKRKLISVNFNIEISFGEDLIFNLHYLKNCSYISLVTSELIFHERANKLSLVNQIYPYRLFEIEAIHASVLEFYGTTTDSNLHAKYVRDVLICIKTLLQSMNDDNYAYLTNWLDESYIMKLGYAHLSLTLPNYVLLYFVRNRMWNCAKLLIRWKNKCK